MLLDVPEDIAHGEHDFDEADFWIDEDTTQIQARRFRPDPQAIERAAALLAKAERPLILAGGGIHVSAACDALQALAERQGIPVAHTMSGKGAIACTHALSAGLFGRYDRIANALIEQSDCLLVVGCKLGEIATKRFQLIPQGKTLIHVEIDPTEIGRTTRAHVALVGDARLALQDLSAALGNGRAALERRAEWLAEVPRRMAEWKAAARERLGSTESPINVGRIFGELNKLLPDDGVLVADGGFATHWGGLMFDTRWRRPPLRARPRLCLDRLRRAGGHQRAARRGARPPRRLGDGRRWLQHEPGRARDGAAARRQLRRHRLQQCRLGLREGAAARRLWRWQLPIIRPKRAGLRRHCSRLRLPRHPRSAIRRSWARRSATASPTPRRQR